MTIEEKAKLYDEAVENMRKFRNALDNHEEIDLWVLKKEIVKDIEYYFPELKESEDERIRKTIIDIIKSQKEQQCHIDSTIYDEMLDWLEKQGEQNPYSGVTLDYNGHIWGMCARDGGVEILFDGELKAFLSLEKSFIYPIQPQPELAPKSALETIKEEKVDKQNCVKPTYKAEPKFKVGDWVVRDNTTAQILDIQEQYYIGLDIDGDDFTSSKFLSDDKIHLWTIQDAKDGDVLVDACGNIGIFEKDME